MDACASLFNVLCLFVLLVTLTNDLWSSESILFCLFLSLSLRCLFCWCSVVFVCLLLFSLPERLKKLLHRYLNRWCMQIGQKTHRQKREQGSVEGEGAGGHGGVRAVQKQVFRKACTKKKRWCKGDINKNTFHLSSLSFPSCVPYLLRATFNLGVFFLSFGIVCLCLCFVLPFGQEDTWTKVLLTHRYTSASLFLWSISKVKSRKQ